MTVHIQLTGSHQGALISIGVEVVGDQLATVADAIDYYRQHLEALGLVRNPQRATDQATPLTTSGLVTTVLPRLALDLLTRLVNHQPVVFDCADGVGRFLVQDGSGEMFGMAAALALHKAGLAEWRANGLHLTSEGAEYARYLLEVGDPRD